MNGKKLLLTLLIALAFIACSEDDYTFTDYEVVIPDDAFREYVLTNFDADNNGVIMYSETRYVTDVTIEGNGYKSLEGIEHFYSLESLTLETPDLETFEISQNKKLRKVTLNGITGDIKFGNRFNTVTELNLLNLGSGTAEISGCRNLENLTVTNCDNLRSVDMSGLKELKKIRLWHCYDFGEVDLSENDKLEEATLSICYLDKIVIGNKPALRSLEVWDYSINELELGEAPLLGTLRIGYDGVYGPDLTVYPELAELEFWADGDVPELDLRHNRNLRYASLHGKMDIGKLYIWEGYQETVRLLPGSDVTIGEIIEADPEPPVTDEDGDDDDGE
ncbi:MAG: hypothetical protein LIO85_03420 [Rikenellaceae bacterium]|nr:hypothetical protein [Rikenellaceae bacterium]